MTVRNPMLAIAVFLVRTAALAQTTPAEPAALTALNNAFRSAYGEARNRVEKASGPTLVVGGDTFILLRGGQRREETIRLPAYDALKTIAHVPLAIYVTLTPGDGAIDEDRLKTLKGLRELVPPAESSLDALHLPAATLARQKRILAVSLAFLDETAGQRRFARQSLLTFTRRMAPLVMENVGESARAQLDATHALLSAWRKEMSPEEWKELRVVIIGPHMPREDLVVTQYFLRLLHEPREGGRVVYAESQWEERQALDLLGTHLLDGGIGDAFFGEPLRMHRDLLGDAARQYLPRLLPEGTR